MVLVEYYTDGDITHVSLDEKHIGVIRSLAGFYKWVPGNVPAGLQIGPTMSLSKEDVIDLLDHCIPRQLAAIERGEQPDSNLLHPDLRPYRADLGFAEAVRHPLLYMFGAEPGKLEALINATYKHKRKLANAYLTEKKWRDYIAIHERPYRLFTFETISHKIDDNKQYWSLLSWIWTDSENIHECYTDWVSCFTSGRDNRNEMMTQEDQLALAAMPDTITIYRGVGHKNAIHGMSWTTDITRARWFAKRFSSNQKTKYIGTGEVLKKDVIAYFTTRNENEIVILPKDLKSLKIVKQKT